MSLAAAQLWTRLHATFRTRNVPIGDGHPQTPFPVVVRLDRYVGRSAVVVRQVRIDVLPMLRRRFRWSGRQRRVLSVGLLAAVVTATARRYQTGRYRSVHGDGGRPSATLPFPQQDQRHDDHRDRGQYRRNHYAGRGTADTVTAVSRRLAPTVVVAAAVQRYPPFWRHVYIFTFKSSKIVTTDF